MELCHFDWKKSNPIKNNLHGGYFSNWYVIFQISPLFFKSVRYFSNQSVINNNPLMTDNGLILSQLQKIMQYSILQSNINQL